MPAITADPLEAVFELLAAQGPSIGQMQLSVGVKVEVARLDRLFGERFIDFPSTTDRDFTICSTYLRPAGANEQVFPRAELALVAGAFAEGVSPAAGSAIQAAFDAAKN